MGGPCDLLVPAAILYDNPGLNLKEFSGILRDSVSNIRNPELKGYLPFDEHNMGRILNIRHTPQFEAMLEKDFDREFSYEKKGFSSHLGRYTVSHRNMTEVLSDNLIVDTYVLQSSFYFEYKQGEHVCHDNVIDAMPCLNETGNCLQVKEVLETKSKELNPADRIVMQRLRTRMLHFEEQEEEFQDIESLVSRYPEYSPREMFDFSQEKGLLFPDGIRITDKDGQAFRWRKDGERYFLDLDFLSLNLSPNSAYCGDARMPGGGCAEGDSGGWVHKDARRTFSLSDLVLTCEAVRRKCWNVLGYVGIRKEFLDFIYGDPATLARYEKAVFDSEMSVYAGKQGWTHSEFLRNHAIWQANNKPIPFTERVRIYKEWKEEQMKELENRRIQQAALAEARIRDSLTREKELPF